MLHKVAINLERSTSQACCLPRQEAVPGREYLKRVTSHALLCRHINIGDHRQCKNSVHYLLSIFCIRFNTPKCVWVFDLFWFYQTNVQFYYLLFNTYISLKTVQHVSNLIWGSSSGTSVLNYSSPSSKVHVRLYTIKCCICCLVVTEIDVTILKL